VSESKTYVNADTYQTLKELKVAPQPYEKNITPLWKPATGQNRKKADYSLFVATPVHSECSIHYTQALLELQKMCIRKKCRCHFSINKIIFSYTR
jgi:hypothetical protein